MSEVALTVIGVVNKNGGVPTGIARAVMAAQPPKATAEPPAVENPLQRGRLTPPQAKKKNGESSRMFRLKAPRQRFL